MKQLHKVVLQGTVGNVRRDEIGIKKSLVARFSLSVSHGIDTYCFRISACEDRGIDKDVLQSISKGDTVLVTGRMGSMYFIDKEGVERRIYEVVAKDVTKLDNKQ